MSFITDDSAIKGKVDRKGELINFKDMKKAI